MKLVYLAALWLLLSGCAMPVWETVEDELPVSEVSVWQEETYTIQLGLPETVSLTETRDGWQSYSDADGILEIETGTFLTSGMDSAVRMVSGFNAEDLTVLQTSRFGMPEYQFAWVSQTEQGSRLYRADLVLDGTVCYAVICSRPETAGNDRDQQIRQVFSTFGLFTDEEV